MSSTTPSPPYMPQQPPRDPSMLKHLQGGGGGGGGGSRHPSHHPHSHHPPPGVHNTSSSSHPNNSTSTPPSGAGGSSSSPSVVPLLHHATPLSHHLQHNSNSTPHSTLQSSSSNQSSSRGGGGASSSNGGPSMHVGRANGAPGARVGGPVLNISAMSSKHSVGGNSGSVSPGTTGTGTRTTGLDQSRDNSHLTDLSHISRLTPLPPKPHHLHNHISHHSLHHHQPHLHNNSNTSSINSHVNNTTINTSSNGHYRNGGMKGSADPSPAALHGGGSFLPRFFPTVRRSSSSRGLLNTLGLLCLISLLLASLALTFLVDITPRASTDTTSNGSTSSSTSSSRTTSARTAGVLHNVTVAVAAVTLSMDLFCVVVCAVQFILAVKLLKRHGGEDRAARYLRQSSVSRVCAFTGFFVSVPLLLSGVIVHTFLVLHSTSAILTSGFIGSGILLCAVAMIHNVVVWQKHKRRSMTQANIQHSLTNGGRPPHYGDPRHQVSSSRPTPPHHLHSTSSPLPPTTVDLSATMNPAHELSTLV